MKQDKKTAKPKTAPQPQAAETPLPQAPRQIVTTKQLAQMIPAYSGKPGAIRWQIFNAETNGLKSSGALIRHGRRILIDVENYFAWQTSKMEAA